MRHYKRSGFSLIELLTAIGVVAVLSVIVMVTVGTLREQSYKTKGVTLLRNNGQALSLYLIDNNNQLPGPLWAGQMAVYKPDREGRLINHIGKYLDVPGGLVEGVVEDYIPPAYKAVIDSGEVSAEDARIYVMNTPVFDSGKRIEPYGSPPFEDLPPEEINPPMRISALPQIVSENWIMMDVDQHLSMLDNKYWGQFTPTEPIYGDTRMALFLDGRIECYPAGRTPTSSSIGEGPRGNGGSPSGPPPRPEGGPGSGGPQQGPGGRPPGPPPASR